MQKLYCWKVRGSSGIRVYQLPVWKGHKGTGLWYIIRCMFYMHCNVQWRISSSAGRRFKTNL